MDKDVIVGLARLCSQSHGLRKQAALPLGLGQLDRVDVLRRLGQHVSSLLEKGRKLLPSRGVSPGQALGIGAAGGAAGGLTGGGLAGLLARAPAPAAPTAPPAAPGAPGAPPEALLGQLKKAMDKQAFLGALLKGLGRGAMAGGGGLARGLGAAGRQLMPSNLGRTAAMGIPLGGAAATGGRALYNDANATVGQSANPFTWIRPQTQQQVFDRYSGQHNSQLAGHQSQIDHAYAGGDFEQADQLQQQLQSGDFGQGMMPSLGGWNPWATPNASANASVARGLQPEMRARMERMQGRLTERGPQMPSDARTSIERQLAGLRQRTSTVLPSYGQETSPASPAPTGGQAPLGLRPQTPGVRQGFSENPFDYRPDFWGQEAANGVR